MDGAARARRRVGELALLRLGERDELGERARGKCSAHHKYVRRIRDQTHESEILAHIEAQVLHHRWIDREARARAEEERIAVGWRPHDRLGAHDARRPGAILDHDALAEPFGEIRRKQTGGGVGRPAGRERHHQLDRPLGIGREGHCRRERSDQREHATPRRSHGHAGIWAQNHVGATDVPPAKRAVMHRNQRALSSLSDRAQSSRLPRHDRQALRKATSCGEAMTVAAGLAAGSLRCMKPCSASG
jgi:hypothetical protein